MRRCNNACHRERASNGNGRETGPETIGLLRAGMKKRDIAGVIMLIIAAATFCYLQHMPADVSRMAVMAMTEGQKSKERDCSNLEPVMQNPELPNGCEMAALATLLGLASGTPVVVLTAVYEESCRLADPLRGVCMVARRQFEECMPQWVPAR